MANTNVVLSPMQWERHSNFLELRGLRRDSKLGSGQVVALTAALVSSEREMIERALAESGGQVGGVSGAAAKLHIPRQTLESKIKILGINKFLFKRT